MVTALSVLLAITAVLGWVNERFIKIPTTVGVVLAGALSAALVVALESLGLSVGLRDEAEGLLVTLDFSEFVLTGILSILLFAGAFSLDARQLLRQRASILTLAVGSTLISTALIGVGSWVVFGLVGIDLPLLWCLLFGALISPTDPVAILDLLKRAKVPERLRTLIAGESLFNDGVGIVVFIAISGVLGLGGHDVDPGAGGIALIFVREALGGLAFGVVIGWVGYTMCRTIDGHVVEVIITLAVVISGYTAAVALGVSGPLAMVMAGLMMSAGKERAFYGETRHLVEGFWETLDQVLNVLLFAFIGFDVLLAESSGPLVLASLLMVGVALVARFISVAVPMVLVRRRDGYGAWTVRLLTWGGLRGGIAISLALGLPAGAERNAILTATYAVVLFTIAVQGLTVGPVIARAAAGLKSVQHGGHHHGRGEASTQRTASEEEQRPTQAGA
ncbi:MAG: sodium:proton antiporter [Ornithinibacter sp.]